MKKFFLFAAFISIMFIITPMQTKASTIYQYGVVKEITVNHPYIIFKLDTTNGYSNNQLCTSSQINFKINLQHLLGKATFEIVHDAKKNGHIIGVYGKGFCVNEESVSADEKNNHTENIKPSIFIYL